MRLHGRVAGWRAEIAGCVDILAPPSSAWRLGSQIVHEGDRKDARPQRPVGGDLADIDLIAAAGVPGGMDHSDSLARQRKRIDLRPPCFCPIFKSTSPI